MNTNAGRISITGGTVEFAQTLANSTGGLITGRGTLIFDGGLEDDGQDDELQSTTRNTNAVTQAIAAAMMA